MELKEIAAVAGKPGLFRVIKPTRTGVILETLDENKKKLIANANARVSILKEISIYTTGAESSIMLEDVFKIIKDKYDTELPITNKANASELHAFITEIIPDYDEDRVYDSDIKKLISWYNLVTKHAPELLESKAAESEENSATSPDATEEVEEENA